MAKVFITLLTLMACFLATAAHAGNLAPALQDYLPGVPADQPVSVIVHLAEQAPVTAISRSLTTRQATRKQRHQEIVEALKDATRSQAPLISELNAAGARGSVVGYTSYWIANLLVVEAVPAEIERIAARSDVAYVESNFTATLIEPVEAHRAYTGQELETDERGIGITPGLEAIRAPEVWELLGIDGSGAIIGSCDTGVDGNHPAINSRWRGLEAPASECWFDFIGSDPTFPTDNNSHGTHTVGTMCGLAPDDTIGVAPGAQWIAANPIDQNAGGGFDNDIIACFQWFTDPDGDPDTFADVPDVVQNSWGITEDFASTPPYTDCDSRWWAVIDNCEAAGVVVTWSAGNEGFEGLRSPADRSSSFTNAFSVGSTLATAPYTISSFSSRGPSACPNTDDPDLSIKPEVSAPGSDIYSSTPGGTYGYKSGTSMAGPHVAGVVALMRSAAPDMEVQLIKQVLMETCVDLGSPGEDNNYGWGIIDAYAAVQTAMEGFGTIEGAVTNASYGGVVLPGARVELPDRGYGFSTQSDGRYSGMVAPGTHLVVCNLDGFDSQEATVVVEEDGLVIQDFQLVDIAGPAITNVDGLAVTDDTVGPYVVSAEVNDLSTVGSVTLYWRAGQGSWQTVLMTAAGNTYTSSIPGQPANTAISYYVHAIDGIALTSMSPEGAPGDHYDMVIAEATYTTAAEDPGDPTWTVGLAGDQASSGNWVRAEPVGTTYQGGPMQTDEDHTPDLGVACYVTENGLAGGEPGDSDVDGGCTTLLSPVFDLSNVSRAFVSYWRWFGQDGFTVDDDWVVEATSDGGNTWVDVERIFGNFNYWTHVAVELDTLVSGFDFTDQVQIRFLACDLGGGGLVEAAIDDFQMLVYQNEVSAVEDVVAGPRAVLLRQNQPNPFNPTTTITFALPRDSQVDLAVYGVDGRLVATLASEMMTAGEHAVTWHGRDQSGRRVSSGAYFYRLVADGQLQVKRMVLVK